MHEIPVAQSIIDIAESGQHALVLFDLGDFKGRARPLQEGVDRPDAIVAGGRLQTRLPHANDELAEFDF
jgi:hypothetical protein